MPQLHEDLVAIRTHKQLSVQDVHDQTRITMYNIEQLENGMMFDSDRNPTYIRNFARTYGKGLGISLDDMSRALDMMNAGNYDGFLARKYIPGQAPPADSPPETPAETPASSSPETSPEAPDDTPAAPARPESKPAEQAPEAKKKEKSRAASGKEPSPSETAKPAAETAGQPPAAGEKKEDKKAQKSARRVLDGSSIKPGYGVVGSKKPGARDVNWSKLRQDAEKPKSGLSIQLIGGIVLIVLLLAGLTYWLTLPDDDFDPANEDNAPGLQAEPEAVPLPDTTATSADPLSSDTLDAPVPPDPSTTSIALADTMEVVVYAATDNLAPFRVESDTFEQRRPYWVEQGEAMRISFVDEMRLSFNLADMLVLYEGRVLTEFDEASTNSELVITRRLFEEAEGLEAITQEDFPEGIEPPRRINDRPIME